MVSLYLWSHPVLCFLNSAGPWNEKKGSSVFIFIFVSGNQNIFNTLCSLHSGVVDYQGNNKFSWHGWLTSNVTLKLLCTY